MVRIGCAVLVLLFVRQALSVAGDARSVMFEFRKDTLQWTGNLRIDLVGQSALWDKPLPGDSAGGAANAAEKSPWLAAGLSAVIPGAGEFYAGSYLKGAIFFALEVAAVTAAVVYNNKGDKQTESFQSYADANWSVVSYGQYAESHMSPVHPPYNWLIPGTEQLPPWERVNWSELNRMERDIGSYYSHTLPPYGEQQYYELIGKYHQYNQGWDDAPPTFTYGDPVTPHFQYYAGQRGLANDYYSTSSTAVVVVVVNHILSAADAAWSASLHNREIHAHATMMMIPAGPSRAVVPALTVSYGF